MAVIEVPIGPAVWIPSGSVPVSAEDPPIPPKEKANNVVVLWEPKRPLVDVNSPPQLGQTGIPLPQLTTDKSLLQKAERWAVHNPVALGAVGVVGLAGVVASLVPLWLKVVKPRLDKNKAERTTGRFRKRSFDDELVEEILADPEIRDMFKEISDALEL